jgi:hypothetical protein
LQDAAAALGVSINTLRKRIRSGHVSAERVQRPQGYVWQVYLDTLQSPEPPGNDPPIQEAPSRLQQPASALIQAEAMAAYTRSLLEPLVTLVEQQGATIREQAETIGTLLAENAALTARTVPEIVQTVQESRLDRWRVWITWALTVLVLGVAITLVVWPG